MAVIDTPTQKREPKKYNYAGFWIRFGAFAVDVIILSPFLLIHQISINFQLSNPSFVNKTVTLSCWIIFWLYFALLESSKMQGTVGKWVFGLKVIHQTGRRVSELRATGRYFSKILSTLSLYVGFFMIGWTKRKQGLHDFVVQSYVVREEKTKITIALQIIWKFISAKIINEESSIGRKLKVLRVFILSKTIDNKGRINLIGYGAICSLILVSLTTFLYLNSGYKSYSECILDKMPGTSNTSAAASIRAACKEITSKKLKSDKKKSDCNLDSIRSRNSGLNLAQAEIIYNACKRLEKR